jgi:hypothetical protein
MLSERQRAAVAETLPDRASDALKLAEIVRRSGVDDLRVVQDELTRLVVNKQAQRRDDDSYYRPKPRLPPQSKPEPPRPAPTADRVRLATAALRQAADEARRAREVWVAALQDARDRGDTLADIGKRAGRSAARVAQLTRRPNESSGSIRV